MKAKCANCDHKEGCEKRKNRKNRPCGSYERTVETIEAEGKE